MPKTRVSVAGGGASGYYVRDLTTICTNSFPNTFSANRLYYTPIQVFHPLTVDGIIVINASVAAGNRYVALYDSAFEAPVNRLAVSLSTIASGTQRRQYIPFTASVQIQGGIFFAAIIADAADESINATGDNSQINPAGINNGLNWYIQEMGAYLQPPNPATPVQTTVTTRTYQLYLRVASIP